MDGTIGSFVIADVRYPCPGPDVLTFGEAHFIKQASGMHALQAMQAMGRGDSDAMAAYIVVSMRRAGRKIGGIEQLFDMQLGGVDFDPAEDEEDEAVPPPAGAQSADATGSSTGGPATTPEPSGTQSSASSSD